MFQLNDQKCGVCFKWHATPQKHSEIQEMHKIIQE